MQTSKEIGKTASVKHKGFGPSSRLLEIQREFSAPVEKLFHAFTESEILKIWWWPKNFYADEIHLDFKEGGRYFINMKGYEHGSGGMTGEFKEIVENERIVMTDYFADKKGHPISAKEAGMKGTWPEVIYITLDFSDAGENRSSLHLSQEGIPKEVQKDCTQGWQESFDKLEAYLIKTNSLGL